MKFPGVTRLVKLSLLKRNENYGTALKLPLKLFVRYSYLIESPLLIILVKLPSFKVGDSLKSVAPPPSPSPPPLSTPSLLNMVNIHAHLSKLKKLKQRSCHFPASELLTQSAKTPISNLLESRFLESAIQIETKLISFERNFKAQDSWNVCFAFVRTYAPKQKVHSFSEVLCNTYHFWKVLPLLLGGTPRKKRWGLRQASQIPDPTCDQNLWYSLPRFWPVR